MARYGFIALSGDSAPPFTTITHVVSTLGDDVARDSAAVVAVCEWPGLLGREMFAADGTKLPSNAAKPGVDAGPQIIGDAQAHATGSEHEWLRPVVETIRPLRRETSLITADAGDHSEANLRGLVGLAVDAPIADCAMRRCVCS